MSNISRRQILQAMGKGLAVFALVPFVGCDDSSKQASVKFGLKAFSENLVLDGEVITGAHWGVLKATIKDGKVISSVNALQNSVPNPLHSTIADLIYTPTRIKYPMVRKSYLENPASPKPELRGADEWVRVSYDEAIALIAKELRQPTSKRAKKGFLPGRMAGKVAGIFIILESYCKDLWVWQVVM